MPASFYCSGPYQALIPDADDGTVLMYADWHYRHMPVLTARTVDRGLAACTTLQCFDAPCFQQIAYRLLICLAGGIRTHAGAARSVGVGILGYAQSVGQLHGSGIGTTDGLRLVSACDLNPERRAQAKTDFPDIKLYESAGDMAGDPEVELVIVATAPNTHASLAVQMMSQGKHVVCEKPLALSRKETEAMLETSVQQSVHLSCHQNRRFDVDYRAIKQAIVEGLIGDLFYMETFVGGFSHPCGYWHSHEPISGGTAYDWGGHYLDWIVSLIPDRIKSVTGTSHKRVWHDVTNADQERIHVRFAGGQEAEFMHSDIAAARKPKWYLLGTMGAIVSAWRDVTQYDIDPVLYFREQQIPATEMPPELNAYRYHHSGEIVRQRLAMPRREHFLFYRNLADHLLTGEPLVAPLSDSMKVVAILEAAQHSVRTGCPVEVVND
jgi:predicted dehydrogenase